jgi:L-threonylcarbamoyladenylate synthase
MIPWLNITASVAALQRGELIAYPTEAVYGIGCLCEEDAIAKVLGLKDRPCNQGLLIVVHEFAQCAPWVCLPQDWSPVAIIEDRPVTWVAKASDLAPRALLGPGQTLAFRISLHPVIQALTRAVAAPMVSTSANLKGERAAMTPEAVMAACGHAITGITVGDLGGHAAPSTIRHVEGGILRP